MGQKGHKIFQKWLKRHEKRQQIEFLDLKNLLFSGIFLSRIGGYPLHPSTENQCEKKKFFFLSGKGGTPPPLTAEFR